MPFLLLVVKNLRSRAVRSALTAAAIAVAIGAMVSLVSFSRGLEKSSSEVYRGHGIDLVVLRTGVTERLTSNLNERLADRLAVLPDVKAVNPSLTELVSFDRRSLIGVTIHGWPPEGFAVRTLEMKTGRKLRPNDRSAILLGEGLAHSLGKSVGNEVTVEESMFHVVGVFVGANLFENSTAVMALSDLQRLMDRVGQVTEFQIQLSPEVVQNPAAVDSLRHQIGELQDQAGNPFGLRALATEEYVTSSSEIQLTQALANVTSIIALLLGSVSILNTMVMSVLERTQEIGTLRALGWPKSRVLRMILWESVILAVAGAAMGMVFAWLTTEALANAPSLAGLVRPQLSLVVLGEGFLLAMVVGLVGGLYPSWRGMRLLPSEALHYE